MNPDDDRCQSGAMIRVARSERLYRVIRLEDDHQQNYGRLGGTLGGGLFVQMEGEVDQRCPTCHTVKAVAWTHRKPSDLGHVDWLSAETVLASNLMTRAPAGIPDVLEEAA